MQKGNRRSGTHYRKKKKKTVGENEGKERNRRVEKKSKKTWKARMVTIPIPPVTQPYPSLPLLVFWDSDQQKPCCETGPEQKLALKTKTSVKKMDMYF